MECENSTLPQILTKLAINSKEELNIVWKQTIELRENTPYSFKELPELKMIFNTELQPKDEAKKIE